MEHSLLHGLQICGLIFGLGGIFFRFWFVEPVRRQLGPSLSTDGLQQQIRIWIFRAIALGAFASIADLFTQVAEIEGRTIYSGVNSKLLGEFLFQTTVGNLSLLKAVLLAFAAVLAMRDRSNLSRWVLCCALIACSILSPLVSHSAALPQGRTAAVVAQVIHLWGAALWLGMLGFIAITAFHLKKENELELLRHVVLRFSPIALACVAVLLGTGIYSAVRFIESPGAILVSPYGLTLLLKLVLLCCVCYAGFQNWRSIRPALIQAPDFSAERFPRFRKLLELELTAGVLVILVAGILGAISPPAEQGSAQLTRLQVQTLLNPRLPPLRLVDPQNFVGAAERTDDDLRYAEFTHQWSGVFVLALGSCWLIQGSSIKAGRVVARLWPIVLILFGAFIAVIADPEVWILRSFSVLEIISNPQVIEHQIGALMVFILAWLGFRDYARPRKLQPLGHAFPLIVIAGSLMLLGHAHSSFAASEELSNLINTEHAVMGIFGLFAGVCRWVQIRDLPGATLAARLWPVFLISLGVFMALFYRELIPCPAPSNSRSISEYVETT